MVKDSYWWVMRASKCSHDGKESLFIDLRTNTYKEECKASKKVSLGWCLGLYRWLMAKLCCEMMVEGSCLGWLKIKDDFKGEN